MERGVPDLYLLPDELFDIEQGISAADVEFPAYFNYFIKGKPLRVICRKHQVRPLLRVLREAVFGPLKLAIEKEFTNGQDAAVIPDLRKEMNYFKKNPSESRERLRLKHIVSPILFDENDQVEVDGARITIIGQNCYRIERDGDSCEIRYEHLNEQALPLLDPGSAPQPDFYQPPLFGITVIGSGHGFDSQTATSGFIIWIGGKGILVDPPVNSTAWLKQNNINTRLIEDVILTHCHADHDAGTLQKILEEGRVRVHTTETIMSSFITKYRTLTGLSSMEFRALFSFEPVYFGQPVSIAGGQFRFKYTLHSIPTVSFRVNFQGKSFAYSSDTLYDPAIIQMFYENSMVSKERKEELLSFPWNSSVVFHEAGIPPIHTPIESLVGLPDEIKEHLYLIHVSEEMIPEGSGLRKAPAGAANTICIDVEKPETSLAHRMLDVLAHVDLFRHMEVGKAAEFLSVARYSTHEPGDVIIHQGTRGDRFYMILSGEVEVITPSLPNKLVYSRYDYLGETAIILKQPRNADVVARTSLELLSMKSHDFLHFIRDTNLQEDFTRLALNRQKGARWLFESHPILKTLSPYQKNQLMRVMRSRFIPAGTYLYQINEPVMSFFWIDEGEVDIWGGTKKYKAQKGALLGEFDRYLTHPVYTTEARAVTDLQVYRIPADDLKTFFRTNPGIYLRLLKAIEAIKSGILR